MAYKSNKGDKAKVVENMYFHVGSDVFSYITIVLQIGMLILGTLIF